MLKEDELAARFEHSVDSAQCFEYVGNRAHCERTDHGVHTGVAKRDLLAGQTDEFDIDVDPAPLLRGAPEHARVRLERKQFAHFAGIVICKVDARADAQL